MRPEDHPEWLAPHSQSWYERLARETGQYRYPWQSESEGPTADEQFMSLLSEWIVSGTRVLDAGCGHGDEAESEEPSEMRGSMRSRLD